ncbi:MAG: hypothetical protein FJY99_01895 [Candidatus Sericytochromatia bacterium]|nr:hypothetical protein [Candidatus Tanganyikabacteria bacterium]
MSLEPRARWLCMLLVTPLLAGGPARAASTTEADRILSAVMRQDRPAFEGQRQYRLVRQTAAMEARMHVAWKDERNYRVTIQDPPKLSDVRVWLDDNRAHVHFPMENLFFRNDNPAGASEVGATVLGQVTQDGAALVRNYDLRVLDEAERERRAIPGEVAGEPCDILEATPAGQSGNDTWSRPAHRFWVARGSGHIMREERSWGSGLAPFFLSWYDAWAPRRTPVIGVPVPRDVNRVELAAASRDNSFRTFRSAAEAEKAIGEPVAVPRDLPAGFRLVGIQCPTFYRSRLILQSYTDGLNWLYVQYRGKPNLWVTLVAGAQAVRLVDKFQELAFQAPYNYYGAEKGEQIVFVYGDLPPDELKRVTDSLPLPSKGRS